MVRTLLALLVAVLLAAAVAAQETQIFVPLATEAHDLFAQLAVSRDGRELTIRGPAPDTLRVCVEPAAGRFGRRVCFTVGDVRRGQIAATPSE